MGTPRCWGVTVHPELSPPCSRAPELVPRDFVALAEVVWWLLAQAVLGVRGEPRVGGSLQWGSVGLGLCSGHFGVKSSLCAALSPTWGLTGTAGSDSERWQMGTWWGHGLTGMPLPHQPDPADPQPNPTVTKSPGKALSTCPSVCPQGKCHRMTAAGPLLLAVISSVLWLTRGFDPAPSACSALASGVLYGSFSLKDLFPTISSGCSWTLENPDPTKYSLYLRFNREEQVCTHFSPMVLPLDHYLANYTCDPRGEASPAPTRQHPEQQQEEEEDEEAELELCEGTGPFTFLHFDKNFVQLCLAAEPEAAPRLLEPQALEFRFVEVLLINNNNSSQFTCSVLCRWLEECLQAPGARRCGFTHAGCSCQAESPPAPRRNGTRPPAHPVPTPAPPDPDCCPTELHSANANELELPEVPHGEWG